MLQIIAAWAASTTIGTSQPPAVLASHDPRPRPPRHASFRTPGIRVWTSGGDLHRRGDRVQLYYRTERDAYVTIFRIDTDGRVQLLFPRYPGDENYGYGGATYSVANYDRSSAFYVDDYPGVGYLFAVASTDPFNYDAIINEGRWYLDDVSDGRIHGDPRSSMEEIAMHLMPVEYADFDTHLLPYYVERRYDYPRFVCYDCHTYTPFAYWDPYLAWCRRFTLVVFNDPYYYYPSYWYPTRYYGGTYYGGSRVVYTQPRGSRYVFKTREGSSPGVDYRDRRTTSASTANRRDNDDGVRGRDLGGTGSVPAPRSPNRRTAPTLSSDSRGERPASRDAADEQRDPPVVGAGDPRRRASDPQAPQSQSPEGGRRRVDGQPGIEIVPPEAQSGGRRPASKPQGSGDRPTSREGEPARPSGTRRSSEAREAVPAAPDGSYGNEARPPRAQFTPHTEPARSPRERADLQDARVQPRAPESTRDNGASTREVQPPEIWQPPRESRPAPQRDASPAPQAGGQPRSDASPPSRESRPPREVSRPPSSPPREAARPPSSPPASRPQSGGQSRGGSNPDLVRRRP